MKNLSLPHLPRPLFILVLVYAFSLSYLLYTSFILPVLLYHYCQLLLYLLPKFPSRPPTSISINHTVPRLPVKLPPTLFSSYHFLNTGKPAKPLSHQLCAEPVLSILICGVVLE